MLIFVLTVHLQQNKMVRVNFTFSIFKKQFKAKKDAKQLATLISILR